MIDEGDGRADESRNRNPSALRILLIQPQAENAGAQAIARSLASALSLRGYLPEQIFFYRKTGAFDREADVSFCADSRPTSLSALLRFFFGLVKLIRRKRPDAVICFQHYGNIIGACAARLAGVRIVVANLNSARDTTPAKVRWLDQLLGSIGLYRQIVVNSHDSASDLQDYPTRYLDRVVHIDHGFVSKTSLLTPPQARLILGLPEKEPLLGCVARLHPLKNLAAAIRVLTLEPDWHLALVGQGAEEADLIGLAQRLGCADRLHLIGELPPESIGDFLRALDVFVFPSRAETFGLAAVEAAQAGIPVVANALPVLKEVLVTDHGACALFVNVDDTLSFAKAIRQILNDPELSLSLTTNGANLAARFPLETMANAYDELLQRLLAAA